ncbi:hypothetical protein EKP92_06480 [Escherichia coli]|nr:hypothetical protein [Escherichia coli]
MLRASTRPKSPASAPGFLCLTPPKKHITNCIYLKINRYNSLNIAIQISRSPPKPHNHAKYNSIKYKTL